MQRKRGGGVIHAFYNFQLLHEAFYLFAYSGSMGRHFCLSCSNFKLAPGYLDYQWHMPVLVLKYLNNSNWNLQLQGAAGTLYSDA